MLTRVQKWCENTQFSMNRSFGFLFLYFLNYIPNVFTTDFQLKNLLLAFFVEQVGHRAHLPPSSSGYLVLCSASDHFANIQGGQE